MALQLHRVPETFSTLFTLEGFFICMSPEVLVVIPFVRITVITLIKPDTPINVYTRFCLNTAKSKFSLVSPVADW